MAQPKSHPVWLMFWKHMLSLGSYSRGLRKLSFPATCLGWRWYWLLGPQLKVVWVKYGKIYIFDLFRFIYTIHLYFSLPHCVRWSSYAHTLRELRLLLLSSRPRTLQALPSGARKRCTWMRWRLWIRNVPATKTGIWLTISVLRGTCCKHQSPFSKGSGWPKEKL